MGRRRGRGLAFIPHHIPLLGLGSCAMASNSLCWNTLCWLTAVKHLFQRIHHGAYPAGLLQVGVEHQPDIDRIAEGG